MKISRIVFYTLAMCYTLAILIIWLAGYLLFHPYPIAIHAPFLW